MSALFPVAAQQHGAPLPTSEVLHPAPIMSSTKRGIASQVIRNMRTKVKASLITIQAADSAFIDYEFERLKLAEMSCTALAALGFGCSAISYDWLYTQDMLDRKRESVAVVMLAGGVSTLLLLVAIVWRTIREMRWQQAKSIYSTQDNLYTTGKYKMMTLELLVNLVFPIYWLERVSFDYINDSYSASISYTVNSMLTIFTLVRLYHLVRLSSVLSMYRSGRAQRVCQMNGAEATSWFAVRCLMKTMPFRMLGLSLLSGMLIGGFCLRIFERPMVTYTGQDFSEYGNTMWLILVTMTTVGYGDYFPVTLPGRMFGIVMCLWGVLIISMFVVALTTLLNLESAEEKSLLILQRLGFKEDMKTLAAHVLTSALRYRWLIRHHPDKTRLQRIQLGKFRRYANEFQLLRNQQRNLYDFDSQEDRIEGKITELLEETEILKGEMQQIQTLAEKVMDRTCDPSL